MPKCVPLPDVPLPELPSPFSIPLPKIPPSPDLTVCCKLLDLPDLPPLGTLGVSIPPEIMAALREGVDVVLEYLDKIPLKCPRE